MKASLLYILPSLQSQWDNLTYKKIYHIGIDQIIDQIGKPKVKVKKNVWSRWYTCVCCVGTKKCRHEQLWLLNFEKGKASFLSESKNFRFTQAAFISSDLLRNTYQSPSSLINGDIDLLSKSYMLIMFIRNMLNPAQLQFCKSKKM